MSPVSPGSPISQVRVRGHCEGHVTRDMLQGAGWARVNRLRSEESGDMGIREIQTESHVQRGLTIENSLSQSWEDLSLVVLHQFRVKC